MGCGTWFAISRHWAGIGGRLYKKTWQHALFRKTRTCMRVEVHIPAKEQTDARLRKGFSECRRGMVYRLFGTYEEWVRSRRTVLTETRIARVVSELLKHRPTVTVPWACELRKIAPERFAELCQYMRSRPECQEFIVALLNAIQPGWMEEVLAADDS